MSLHSGLYPYMHGSISNKESVRLNHEDASILRFFRNQGYRIGWFGKDNHAYERATLDAFLDANTSRRREAFRAYTPYVPPHWYGASPWPNSELFPTKTTDDAIAFMTTQNDDRPFFIGLSLFDPHPPYFAPAEYVAHYLPDSLTIPSFIHPDSLNARLAIHYRALAFDQMSEATLRATMAHYYASIEWGIDHQIGRLFSALETADLAQETMVIFTSDHGDFMGEHGMVRKGMFLHDALLHVPFIWYAPGRIVSGHRTRVLAQGVDLFPTLIDMIQPNLTEEAFPGRSLRPFLEGQAEYNPSHAIFAEAGYDTLGAMYFREPEPPHFSPTSSESKPFHTRVFARLTTPRFKTAMIRTDDWKLVLSETDPPELYRMNDTETWSKNLARDSAFDPQISTLRRRLNENGFRGSFRTD